MSLLTRTYRLSPRCTRCFNLLIVYTLRIVNIQRMTSQQRALPVSPGLTRGFPSKYRPFRACKCRRPAASVQRTETVREDEWAEQRTEGEEQLSGGWMRGEEKRRGGGEERRGRMRAGIHQTPSSQLSEQRWTEHAPISSSRMRCEPVLPFMYVHTLPHTCN